jgi:BNR repeat-like domain
MSHVSKSVHIAAFVLFSLVGLSGVTNAQIDVRVSGPSPFKPGCDRSGSPAVNYENAEVEPWLAIDPNDADHLVGIWQQDRWRQLAGSHGLMTGVSHDGGLTWQRTFAHFSRCAGGNSTNGGDYERASDPWVTISPSGKIYESGVAFNTLNANEAILVSRSTNGGTTWSDPTTLMFDTDPTVSLDKPSSTADPKKPGFVYAIWSRYVYTDPSQSVLLSSPLWLSRTTDGGASWEPARDIYDAPAGLYATGGGAMVVLPNGTLVDMFGQYDGTSSALALFTIRSSDHGLTWSLPTLIDVAAEIGITDVKTGELVRGGGGNITLNPHTGTLYMVWEDATFSGGLRDGIAFSQSTDGGLSWSTPVQVNQAPNVQAFAPSIAINKHGTIAIAYYDFRKDNSDPNVLLTNYWRITSDDGGKTWHEIPLSPSFDLRTAPRSSGFMITDYEGLVPSEESFISFFVMTNPGKTSARNIANRTDVFAVSTEAEGDTTANGHVEINSHPQTMMEQMLSRNRRAPALLP